MNWKRAKWDYHQKREQSEQVAEDNLQKALQSSNSPACPQCKSEMRVRRPQSFQKWQPFWGCSQYPVCKGTRPYAGKNRP